MNKEKIAQNIAELRGRIAECCEECDRDADDITLVAVTKTRTVAETQTALAAGINNIGENRIQDAEPKILEIGHTARTHMLGHLQTNKVKKAVELFDVIQSVDSLRLAEEINRRANELGHEMECFVEVNSSGEESKYGVSPDKTIELVNEILRLPYLRLTGLMTMAPFTEDSDAIREAFSISAQLFRKSTQLAGEQFIHLSMGMTQDFPLAIAEGSTMIRVGQGIFGPRQA